MAPERVFYESVQKVFFDAADRAFSEKLTSRASLELPVLRAFDVFSRAVATSLSKEDVVLGVEWEFLRQKALQERLRELKDHFRLLGVEYAVEAPQKSVPVSWDHSPSYGAWLKIGQEQYPALYAFATMPAGTYYRDGTHGEAEAVVFVDRAVTIVIPHGFERDENGIVIRNEMLRAPIEVFERDRIETKKTFFGGTKVAGVERNLLQRQYEFLFADLARDVSAEDIERWMKSYSVSAVVVADRERNETILHTKFRMPKLHEELRRISRAMKTKQS